MILSGGIEIKSPMFPESMPHFFSAVLHLSLYAACVWAAIPSIAQAQIIPDNTLGDLERSQLIPDVPLAGGEIADIIAGGAERGSNLFHSFTQFNVNNGQTVYFFSPTGIQTIFARVTDGPSTILGNLGTINVDRSPTNLFLLNPNGIIFGPNAQLFVTGSFLGTTASHIRFPEGNFSATQLSATPLLTISAPVGLGFETTPAEIAAQSAQLLTLKDLTLVGGDIAIADSNIIANNHKVELASIGGPTNIGLNLSDTGIRLALPSNSPRADVTLQDKTSLYSGSTGAGSISITARNLTTVSSQISAGIFRSGMVETQAKDVVLDVSERTVLKQESQISNSVLGSDGNGGNTVIKTGSLEVLSGSKINNIHGASGNSGNIIIQASKDVTVQGEAPDDRPLPILSSANTFTLGGERGNSGKIEITARRLYLLDGGSLNTSNDRIGNAGDVKLDVQDAIVIKGTSSEQFLTSGIYSVIENSGQGKGGDVLITTGSLGLSDGASIDSQLIGLGAAGNIIVNARDAVTIEGNAPRISSPLNVATSIRSSIANNAIGEGGDIQINARSLSVSRGASIDSSVFGIGKGGNIIINTQESTLVRGEGISIILPSGTLQSSNSSISSVNLGFRDRSAQNEPILNQGGTIQIMARDVQVLDGGNISTLNAGVGNAGNIEINAGDRITVSGLSRDGLESSISSAIVAGRGETAGLGLLSFQGIGNAGNIKLTADTLRLEEALVRSSSNSPTGQAANIDIQVNNLFVDRARISTASTSGNGGNISINANSLLLLRRNSKITASAGTLDLGGSGGNISLTTTNLVAVPKENSDITANAFTGNGGKISLTTTSLLGIKPQPNLTSFSDITASSAQGIQGSISLTQPDLRPEQGLTELPNDIIDSSNQISPTCPRPGTTFTQGRFIATGRGSLPPTPLDGPSPSLTLPPLARFEKGGKDAIAKPLPKQRAIALARIATSCGLK
jgi:filamentous hemagglutinin family protein